MAYAEVAVNSPAAQRHTFSYAIPPSLTVTVGQAVWVPFGPRLLQGIVFELTELPAVEETKEIAEVIDSRPSLTPTQVELARWISQHYLAPLFDCAALMLPPGFERKVVTWVKAVAYPSQLALASLTSEQKQLLYLLREGRGVAMKEIEKALGKKKAPLVVAQLLRKGVVTKSQEVQKVKVRPKLVPYLSLAREAVEAQREADCLPSKASRQSALLRLLAEKSQPIALSEARKLCDCSAAAVAALQKKGLVIVEQVQLTRDPLGHRLFSPTSPPPLTPAQEAAWQQIESSLKESKAGKSAAFLLYGVTGSGKTEIYLRALAGAVAQGKRGIVLVPEIALTPQTIERFSSRFPHRVAVLHSKLSLGEQFDQWQQIREGVFDVVIGSRGAIFAPQPDLGLIVLDEEHEWTYKQEEQAPRYHAREVALKLAELTGSVVILGSATPAMESFYRAQKGELKPLELPQRITVRGESRLPEVEVVDLREELKAGNTSIFSRSLAKAIPQAVAAREQVILFLNRRGAATFVQCRHCGFVLRCKRCDLALTYHTAEGALICHQCNYRMKTTHICPKCWSRKIKFLGIGTQKVEEEAVLAFPEARLLRWDRDVTRGKYSHEKILEKFRAHEADILIGTQMIAKGLDLPLVTLVGVISADIGLNLPDFRSAERTFQVLDQVAGRAGRGTTAGRVIIQTYAPQHYAVVAAAQQDYEAFYKQEIRYRREYEYPPFSQLTRLLYMHTNAVTCQREAEKMYHRLEEEIRCRGIPNIDLIGPSPAFVSRVRGKFRWQIILRGSNPASFLAELPLPRGWTIDINPVSLL